MYWIMLIIAIIFIVLVIYHTRSESLYISASNVHNKKYIVPKLLEQVEKRGSILVDKYIDCQYSKNGIGWYLNSYDFIEDYNQLDKYIAYVEFYDNQRRCGDVKQIILRINPNPDLNVGNPFYRQSLVIVGKFNISQKKLANKLRCMGATVGSSVHEHTDIILIGDKIKGTQILDKLKSLKNIGYKIREIHKDELYEILREYE